jgi:hypothetical protein
MALSLEEVCGKLSSLIPPMPKMSAREEELELEMEGLDGGYEAAEEEGLVEESTSSHYSPLVDRLFSGYRGYLTGKSEILLIGF